MAELVKLSKYPKLAEFLSKSLAATIAMSVDDEGTIHIASLLYWHDSIDLSLYFVTDDSTEKCRLLKSGEAVKSACVVGTEKGVDFTLQLRGTLSILTEPDTSTVEAYYLKRGNREDDLSEPGKVMLRFKPTWARFNGYAKGYGERHFLSLEVEHA